MPYLHEFGPDDIFVNRMVAYPQYQFTFYSGSAYINNDRDMGVNIPSGSVSLYEYNVDRDGTNQKLIYPFIVKAGQWLSFPNVTQQAYENADYGGKITGSYPLTSSITRQYIPSFSPYPFPDGTAAQKDSYVDSRKELLSLKNTLNYYRGLSDAHNFSGSFVSGTVNLIDIPSIFYDNSIKKGTVDLKFFYTGSLVARAQDTRQNGELVGTFGATSGSVVGLVLYNEGFVLLTSSAALSPTALDNYLGTGTLESPSWLYYGAHSVASISGSTGTFPSASLYTLDLEGTQKIPVMTAFATAQRGHVNNSLNPTWVSASNGDWRASSSVGPQGYVEPRQVSIKNTIESQYCEFDDEFEKQVFISEIGIYDEDKNLIAIAKLANPVLKKETDEMTFKLKLDI
jgi:hypothetical protein